jgi:hypothetical protein
VWPDSWLRCGESPPDAADAAAFAARWVRSHATEAAPRLRKPLLVSEFGTPDREARPAFLATVHGILERSLAATADQHAADEQSSALAGTLLWMVAHPGYPGDGNEVTLPCEPLPAACSNEDDSNAASLAEIGRHAAVVRAWNEAQHAGRSAAALR